MNQFENELKKGNFVVSECKKCKKIVWPPNDYCNNCFGNVTWKKIFGNWKLIEFSKNENNIFCLAEFQGMIRIMGTLKTNSNQPIIGQKLMLETCSYDNEKKFVFSCV